MAFARIKKEIIEHPTNRKFKELGYEPLFIASKTARIVFVGQAPGVRAQESKLPWNDPSGDNLREWLGLSRKIFYDKSLIAHIPMDFYFPGRGKSGDLPPRRDFAKLWHQKILERMPDVQLMILIGQYSQKHYLGDDAKKTLTETVRSYREYFPDYLPLVHPSPRNKIWMKKNPWFLKSVVPVARRRVRRLLR